MNREVVFYHDGKPISAVPEEDIEDGLIDMEPVTVFGDGFEEEESELNPEVDFGIV